MKIGDSVVIKGRGIFYGWIGRLDGVWGDDRFVSFSVDGNNNRHLFGENDLRLSPMKRLRESEFKDKINKADRIQSGGEQNNPTRQGVYFQITKGLSTHLYFVGIAINEENALIYEEVE